MTLLRALNQIHYLKKKLKIKNKIKIKKKDTRTTAGSSKRSLRATIATVTIFPIIAGLCKEHEKYKKLSCKTRKMETIKATEVQYNSPKKRKEKTKSKTP